MGVFKRTRVTKDGVSNQYWYIRYRINRKDKYESWSNPFSDQDASQGTLGR